MSRIGKLPIEVPAVVAINVSKENLVTVKGPLGTLTQKVDSDIEVKLEKNVLTVIRPTEQKRHRGPRFPDCMECGESATGNTRESITDDDSARLPDRAC